MSSRVRTAIWVSAFLFLAILAGYVFREPIFRAMGAFLVDTQPAEHADMIVVIGGDWYGNRILKGAQLAREGYAPFVIASGNGYLYGTYEGEAAIAYAIRHGYDPRCFIAFRHPVTSTREEARALIPELRRRGVKKYILVTSEFHTRRAGAIFRQEGPDLRAIVVACPDTMHWNNWWTDREGRKSFLMEWLKTVTSPAGI